MGSKIRFKSIISLLLMTVVSLTVYAQEELSGYLSVINEKRHLIYAFKNASGDSYFVDCGGNEHDILSRYASRGMDMYNFARRKDDIAKGSNVILSIVNDRLPFLLEKFENEYREFLGGDYNDVIGRMGRGESFYIYRPGELNKLILCGQNVQDIASLTTDAFSATFPTGSIDSDGDGLPDFFEQLVGTDPHKADTDGDGLSDYEEYFKYNTDPCSKDSDGDGIADSDWNERREYAYTIYAKREIYQPYDTLAMNEMFQDSRVISRTDTTLVHETVLYPATINFIIPSKDRTGDVFEDLVKYKEPSFFSDFTPEMTTEMEKLASTWSHQNDYELTELLARYVIVMATSYPSQEPLNFYINVIDNKVNVVYRERFDQFKTHHFTTDQEVMDRLTFGSGMYRNRMRGACGSSSIFYTSIFRAMGFPTRIVVSNPILNFTDDEQVKLIDNLKNEQFRNITRHNAGWLRGYANHFFYEVNIGGRWVRCDYDKVNISCTHLQGLFIVQDKLRDMADADYTSTWGRMMVGGLGNSYKTLELSDQFPVHESRSAQVP